MAEPVDGADRLSALAEEARSSRIAWVSRCWHAGPRRVAKSEVVAFLKSMRPVLGDDAMPCAAQRLQAIAAGVLTALSSPALPASGVAMPRLGSVGSGDGDVLSTFLQPHVDALLLPSPMEVEAERQVGVALLERGEAVDVVSELRRLERTMADTDLAAAVDRGDDADADYDADVAAEAAAAGLDTATLHAAAAEQAAGPKASMAAAAGLPQLQATVSTSRAQRRLPAGSKGDRASTSSTALERGPAAAVVACLSRVEDMLRAHVLWRATAAAAGEAWDAALAAVEKVLMCKLGGGVFAMGQRAPARDWYLRRRFARLQFIDFKHLDLPAFPPWFAPGWLLAATALRHMNRYVAPSDKMECILNACRVVSTMLTLLCEVEGKGDGAVGADEFLPALIYCTVVANPAALYSNLSYIADYSRPSMLMSQSGYFYTNMLSALAFVRSAQPGQLGLSSHEFEALTAGADRTREHAGGSPSPHAAVGEPHTLEAESRAAVAAFACACDALHDSGRCTPPSPSALADDTHGDGGGALRGAAGGSVEPEGSEAGDVTAELERRVAEVAAAVRAAVEELAAGDAATRDMLSRVVSATVSH